MQYFAFALLPALVFAIPAAVEERAATITGLTPAETSAIIAAANSAFPECSTITDAVAGLACAYTYLGWKPAAATYLAQQATDTSVLKAEIGLLTDTAYVAKASALRTNGPAAVSLEAAQASKLDPAFGDGKVLASIDNQALSLQNAAPTSGAAGASSSSSHAAAAPAQTGMHLAAGIAAGLAGLAFAL